MIQARKIVALLMLVCRGTSYAQKVAVAEQGQNTVSVAIPALERKVSLDLTNVTLERAIAEVSTQANIKISFAKRAISSSPRVTLRASSISVDAALKGVLKGTNLAVTSFGGQLTLVERNMAQGSAKQTGVIAGRVMNAKTDKGIEGASVTVADGSGVVSDKDGSYRLAGVTTGNHIISVRSVGYAKQTRSISVGESATVTVDFKLEPSANVLDQVIVTGTIVQTELKAVPTAITVITAKQIEERGITQIDQLFRGDIPGLFAQQQGSATTLGRVTMYSRGVTALPNGWSAGIFRSTNPIKTYIDGIEMADPKYLSQIDTRSIERIEILTGPQASTIYGSNAINGVMQIFTKRGTTSKQNLILGLESGWVENNYSSAMAPQHSYSAQLRGIEGRLSYNAGGSWDYTGQWTPGLQSTRTGGFGGIRAEWNAPVGVTTSDISLRYTGTNEFRRGDNLQGFTALQENGYRFVSSAPGRSAPSVATANGQTIGIKFGHRPAKWWSHEFEVGRDAQATQIRRISAGYYNGGVSDTLLSYSLTEGQLRSIRYVSTPQLYPAPFALLTTTIGADAWQLLGNDLSAQPASLTGTLANPNVSRQTNHNAGGFVQTQLGIQDRIFFTYGLRAEWSPRFGKEVQPNLAPRYGMAFTQDFGQLTAKLRASYGRSTRPPTISAVRGLQADDFYAGSIWLWLPNPHILPEHQQGGEGGLELYLGTRGSLVITRYNQTVDNLIELPVVDSVPSILSIAAYGDDPTRYPEWPDGYYRTYQYQQVNIGSIRNQGWELQSSLNMGPFTTKGTYSFTKSRVLGITPAFSARFPASSYPDYQPGATFKWIAEHTWATSVAYAHRNSTIILNMNSIGQLMANNNAFSTMHLSTGIRLSQNRYRMSIPSTYRQPQNIYTIADLNMAHRFSAGIEGILQIRNLMDYYRNDVDAANASIGRQVKAGARIRL